MVPNQIFDGVQRGASSGKYIVNNAQLSGVGFHRQMKAKTIVADQLGDLIDECNAL
jgi:heme/copper-type cytochrome/quinol oxidase subunit 2